MVIDLDDFGCNREISDMCQSHDCRDMLDRLHIANPAFKVTLFAIPQEMTPELLDWCRTNSSWVSLGVHGWGHTSNYESEKWSKTDMEMVMYSTIVEENFDRLFKAPGWMISQECYEALLDGHWVVADQFYNNERRPIQLPAYVNHNGEFRVHKQTPEHKDGWISEPIPAWHGHTWNCVGNGIYECFDQVLSLVKSTDEFYFVSEVVR